MISDEYRVMVKPFFEEESALRQFEGKELLLPKQKEYYPLMENLRRHKERFELKCR